MKPPLLAVLTVPVKCRCGGVPPITACPSDRPPMTRSVKNDQRGAGSSVKSSISISACPGDPASATSIKTTNPFMQGRITRRPALSPLGVSDGSQRRGDLVQDGGVVDRGGHLVVLAIGDRDHDG